MSILAPIIVGIHLTSVHYAMPENSNQGDYNNVNPGIYIRTTSDYVGGFFKNSRGRTSVYLAKSYGINWTKGKILIGGITGYDRAAVIPLLAYSHSWNYSEQYSGRITITPPSSFSAGVIHFSIERKW